MNSTNTRLLTPLLALFICFALTITVNTQADVVFDHRSSSTPPPRSSSTPPPRKSTSNITTDHRAKSGPSKVDGKSCKPGPNEVAFYQHTNYKGACKVLGIGSYPSASDIGLTNDSISSILVGSGAQVEVCRNSNFGGQCITIQEDRARLSRTNSGGFSDSISSAKVSARVVLRCSPGPNQVAFYEHTHYQGACAVRGIGRYKNSTEMGISNDTISSIKMGANTRVIAFEHVNYGGRHYLYTTSMPILATCSLCSHNKHQAGDDISSVEIIRK